jgi:hypothetical protein
MLLLLPVGFIFLGIWSFSSISEFGVPTLCLEVNGELVPINISFTKLWNGLVVFVGVLLTILALLTARIWWERHIFYNIILKLKKDYKTPQ